MNNSQPRDITAVLVHGGFLGPWIWTDTVRLLSEHNIPSVCADLGAGGDGEEVDSRADGRLVLRPESARAALFNYCTPDRADAAIALLRPPNSATGTQPATGAAWRDVPSTYVRCTQDRLPYDPVAPAFREHAASMLTLPTGHCPQWSRPDLVAELLIRIVSQVRSR